MMNINNNTKVCVDDVELLLDDNNTSCGDEDDINIRRPEDNVDNITSQFIVCEVIFVCVLW